MSGKRLVKVFAATVLGATISFPVAAGNNALAQVDKDRDFGKKTPHRAARVLFDIFFQTPDCGWAVGEDGLILWTTDGGKNWLERKIGDEVLHQIIFQDSARGWLLSDTKLFRTNDAGSTWASVRSPDPRSRTRIYFVNAQVGWLLGKDGSIFKTADAGKSWQRQSSGTKERLDDIACFSAVSCIVSGRKKTLLTTSNGGGTWIGRLPPIAEHFNLRDVRVTRDGTAWVLATAYKAGRLLRSSDRGRTWEIVTGGSLLENPSSLHFFDRNRGLVIDTSILLTEDGGATWDWPWHGGAVPLSIFFRRRQTRLDSRRLSVDHAHVRRRQNVGDTTRQFRGASHSA